MDYYTRLQESPSLPTLAMLRVNPHKRAEVVPLHDHYGRTVAVRTIDPTAAGKVDAVYVCAGDNALFVANVIVLAHAHNVDLDARGASDCGPGL